MESSKARGNVKCHCMLSGKPLPSFHRNVDECGNSWDRDGSGEISKKFSSWHTPIYTMKKLPALHNILEIIGIHRCRVLSNAMAKNRQHFQLLLFTTIKVSICVSQQQMPQAF